MIKGLQHVALIPRRSAGTSRHQRSARAGMEGPSSESEVGISGWANTRPGFTAILKQRCCTAKLRTEVAAARLSQASVCGQVH